MSGQQWVVWDPSDWNLQSFTTETEALAHADHIIEMSLDDGRWHEGVEEIFVAKITHVACRLTEHVRTPEMTDDEWSELTGDGNPEGRTWWGHYVMQAVDAES